MLYGRSCRTYCLESTYVETLGESGCLCWNVALAVNFSEHSKVAKLGAFTLIKIVIKKRNHDF